ncbi:MFS transporter [Robertmurraya andreesenii]|nr:MFS transporter [Robertmurraya andreesenii]
MAYSAITIHDGAYIMKNMKLWVLVGIVAISGFSQGMLMPLIAIIFEQDGLSSSINGLHATGIYIGILLISPFMEKPLQKFGFKPTIIFGGLIVIASLALFPVWKSLWFWFILRLLIGIGDNMLHFGTQTWITSFSTTGNRGRNIALYGLFFSFGFAIGPLMTRLLEVHESLPFIISSALSLAAWVTIFFIRNEFPDPDAKSASSLLSSFKRFGQVWKYAWVAFLPPFGYGFLEATLNGNFPVYALRIGIDVKAVSIILPAFALGSIVFQMPLGLLSDRYGRQRVLPVIMLGGFITFILAGILENSGTALFICFFVAGMLVGSTYSLGISYMADLLPRQLLPAGNIMCSVLFSFGSISGPFIGGLTIQYLKGISFFYFISIMLLCIFVGLILFKSKKETEATS